MNELEKRILREYCGRLDAASAEQRTSASAGQWVNYERLKQEKLMLLQQLWGAVEALTGHTPAPATTEPAGDVEPGFLDGSIHDPASNPMGRSDP